METLRCTYQIQTFSYTPSKKVRTLEERIEDFRESLKSWVKANDPNEKIYPAWMKKDFWYYWTSMNDGGKKMYFEMEKKWATGLRLATWKRNCARDPRWKDYQTYYEFEEVVKIHNDWKNHLKQQDFRQVDKLDDKGRKMWVKK